MTRSVAPVAATEVKEWSTDADVVVIGFGAAGASAAIEAARAGASVLVLDRAGGWGGASAMAGGEIYMGGGTAIQRACGFEDSPEEMYKFLAAATGPDPATAKLELYCDRSVEHFDWLVSCGVPFKASFFDQPCWEPPTDDGLLFTGGENAHPFNEIAVPAPRGHVPRMEGKRPGERSAGWMLMSRLTATAEGCGAEVRFDVLTDRLVVEADGSVVGVSATVFGERKFIRARSGVVLASGGFAYDEAMLALHAPRFVGHNKVGPDTDDGIGLRMAQAVGAAVRHMDAGQVAYPGDPQLMFRSLLLDASGHRFINEDSYPGRVGQQSLYTRGGQTFLLFDDEINETLLATAGYRTVPTWVSDDLEELGTSMGLAPGVLAATVRLYNEGAARGEDPLCHKSARWLKPLAAPYGVLDMRGAPFGIFTTGGLHTTIDAAVLDIDGDVVPGLFAAGRVSSGLPSWGYLSGTSLADSTFFGRRAGRATAG